MGTLWDVETGSLWNQVTCDAQQGAMQGRKLETVMVHRSTWKEWRERYPDTQVMVPTPYPPEIPPSLLEATVAGRPPPAPGAQD